MSSHPTLRIAIPIVLAVMACAVPQAATPTPSPPPLTPVAINTITPTADYLSPSATLTPSPIIPSPEPVSDIPDHRIAVRRVYGVAEFYDTQTGQRFVPRGVNYFYLVQVYGWYEDRSFGVGVYDRTRVQADFQRLHQAGFNTVRMFLDSCSQGPGCMGAQNGSGLNPAYLDNIVDLMNIARENELFLLLTSNDLPDQGGYAELANSTSGDTIAGYRNAYYLTEVGIQAQRDYWSDLLLGLAERNAPFDIVLGWELLNEQWYFRDQPPFSLDAGRVATANGQTYDMSDPAQKQQMAIDGMLYYIEQLREAILSHDPTALVTMGFFVPDYPNPTREGDFRYVETVPLLESAALDFFDFHTYPGVGLELEEIVENFGMAGYIDKPVLMGEVGAFEWMYPSVESAATTIQDWIAGSCQYGFDGWLYWGYYRAPEALGDATWGFADADGFMLEAISPSNQPDACTTTILPGRNLALGAAITASASLPAEPPEQAVDGSPDQWGAGAFPPQWIEIDLGQPQTIGLIRLLVAQWPAGRTIHQIWVAGADHQFRQAHEFSGYTQDFDLLEFLPDAPLTDIQYVRIVTIDSPSWVGWREIEVLAPLLPTPTPAP